MMLKALLWVSIVVASVLAFDVTENSFPVPVDMNMPLDLDLAPAVRKSVSMKSLSQCEAECGGKKDSKCRLIDIDNWHCIKVEEKPCVYFSAKHTACPNCQFYCAQDHNQEHKCKFSSCQGEELRVCVPVWWKGPVSQHMSCENLLDHHKTAGSGESVRELNFLPGGHLKSDDVSESQDALKPIKAQSSTKSTHFSVQKWKKCKADCKGISKKCVHVFNWNGLEKKCVIKLACKDRQAPTCGKTSVCENGYSCESNRCRRIKNGGSSEKIRQWKKCSSECKDISKKCVRVFNWNGLEKKCLSKWTCTDEQAPTCGDHSVCENGYSCESNRCQRNGSNGGKISVAEWKKCSSGCEGVDKKCARIYNWNGLEKKCVIKLDCINKETETCGEHSLCKKGYTCKSDRCRRIGNNGASTGRTTAPPTVTVGTDSRWKKCSGWCSGKGKKCVRVYILLAGGKDSKGGLGCATLEEKTCGEHSLCKDGYECGDVSGKKGCVRSKTGKPPTKTKFERCQEYCSGNDKKCIRFFRVKEGSPDESMGCAAPKTETNCGLHLDCRTGYYCEDVKGSKTCKKGSDPNSENSGNLPTSPNTTTTPPTVPTGGSDGNEADSRWKKCSGWCSGKGKKCVRVYRLLAGGKDSKGGLGCATLEEKTCGEHSLCKDGYECGDISGKKGCVRSQTGTPPTKTKFERCQKFCSGNDKKCIRFFRVKAGSPDEGMGCADLKTEVNCGSLLDCRTGYYCDDNKGSKTCKKGNDPSSESFGNLPTSPSTTTTPPTVTAGGSDGSEVDSRWKKCSGWCSGKGKKCVRVYRLLAGGKDSMGGLGCATLEEKTCGEHSLCKDGYECGDMSGKKGCVRSQIGTPTKPPTVTAGENDSRWEKCSGWCSKKGKKCVRVYKWLVQGNGGKSQIGLGCATLQEKTCGQHSICKDGYECGDISGKEGCVRSQSTGRPSESPTVTASGNSGDEEDKRWKHCSGWCSGKGKKCVRVYEWLVKGDAGKEHIKLDCATLEEKKCGEDSICKSGYECGDISGKKGCVRSQTGTPPKKPLFQRCQNYCSGVDKKCIRYFRVKAGASDEGMGCVDLKTEENCGLLLDCRTGYYCDDNKGSKTCKKGSGPSVSEIATVSPGSSTTAAPGYADVGGASTCTCVRASRCPGCDTESTATTYFNPSCKDVERYVCLSDLGGNGFDLSALLKGSKSAQFRKCAVGTDSASKSFYQADDKGNPISAGKTSFKCLQKKIRTITSVLKESNVSIQSYGSTGETCFCEEEVTTTKGTCYKFTDPATKTCESYKCGNSWKCSANQAPGAGNYKQCRTKTVTSVIKPNDKVTGTCKFQYVSKKAVFFYQLVTIGSE